MIIIFPIIGIIFLVIGAISINVVIRWTYTIIGLMLFLSLSYFIRVDIERQDQFEVELSNYNINGVDIYFTKKEKVIETYNHYKWWSYKSDKLVKIEVE